MPAVYKDRHSAMIIFGVIEILIGLVWLLPTLTMLLPSVKMPPGSSVAMMVAVFGGLAAMSIALGVGTIMPRRWARSLSLLVAWFWLATGLGMLIYSLFAPQMPGAVLGVFVFLTLFATSFVFFYSGKNVKATFEARDPHVRWTDKCPLPVLALSLGYGIAAFGGFMNVSKNIPVPIFGLFLTGAASQIYYVAQIGLSAYLAWGMYRLERNAWWVAIVMTVVMGVSTVITYSGMDADTLYKAMNISAEQIAAMQKTGMGIDRIGQFTGAMIVLWVGYLLYVKRYFDAPPAKPSRA